MSLNPVTFGKTVIDQFARYILSTFPIADPNLEKQVKEGIEHGLGGERLLSRGPFVSLNQPFLQGPGIKELIGDEELNLHPAMAGLFPFETLHKHQEMTLRRVQEGFHTIVATGTGSGKTEAFLLPILNHCLKLRDNKAPKGIAAIIVYPMNALVNDQLERLRILLAGSGITFGRYTGDTARDTPGGVERLHQCRRYTSEELEKFHDNKKELPLPWEESYSRKEIRENKPRILLTNYSQLEYLLLRDRDLELFRGAPLKFLVMDEVHTYTGSLGSEVACLIRRLRGITGKTPHEVTCIATSATVTETGESGMDGEKATKRFAGRLFGIPDDKVQMVTEIFRKISPPQEGIYLPEPADDTEILLEKILEASAETMLKEEPGDIPGELLAIAEELCGRRTSDEGSNNEKLYNLLECNRIVHILGRVFRTPVVLGDSINHIKYLDSRKNLDDKKLTAEILAYLILGTLSQKDGEPLLRPKLHYFVQGLKELYISFDPDMSRIFFDEMTARESCENYYYPLLLCKNCGQHYVKGMVSETVAAPRGGFRTFRLPGTDDLQITTEIPVLLTDKIYSEDEDESGWEKYYQCRHCGSLHTENNKECLSEKCRRPGKMMELRVKMDKPDRCSSCGGVNTIVPVKSQDVFDVMILAQTMLSAMWEKSLQKLLIFADNRQDTAFQAAWMDSRAKRFRLRHILYQILREDPSKVWNFGSLTGKVLTRAIDEQIIEQKSWQREDNLKRMAWFLLEEFAMKLRLRTRMEQLGLAEVVYDHLDMNRDEMFIGKWSEKLHLPEENLVSVIRAILDYYRIRQNVSHPLLQRRWVNQDEEVWNNVINLHPHFGPSVLLEEKRATDDRKISSLISRVTMNWTASNGRSGAQVIMKKSLGEFADRDLIDAFLSDLWEWLNDTGLLVFAELKEKRYGKVQKLDYIPSGARQINIDKIGIKEGGKRFVCKTCRKAGSSGLPTLACPQYHCKGTTQEMERDEEHFDVVQYSKMSFVPMKTYEHSAQLSRKQREDVEKEFKKVKDGKINCIVCTPTLELGVDIGKLEMVLMRNVPPTPANYAQRSGRAGRRHRIAVVFTYCRGSNHGRYFFEKPEEMIAGAIRIPAFSMRNAPLIRKHVHSMTLTTLRELCSKEEKEVLRRTFPPYIRDYFSTTRLEGENERTKYLNSPPGFGEFAVLLSRYRQKILDRLTEIFTNNWPHDDIESVIPALAEKYIDEMSGRLERHVNRLFNEVMGYREKIGSLREKENQDFQLTDDEKYEKKRFENVLSDYRKPIQKNYSLSYLSVDGFFPGYAMNRESVTAQCLEPLVDISRPSVSALRELTPANRVYADRNQFSVSRLNLYRLKADNPEFRLESLRTPMILDREHQYIIDPLNKKTEGGGKNRFEFISYNLLDVELKKISDINDNEDSRFHVGFDIYPFILGEHYGGEEGKIGKYDYRFLRNEKIRLVNTGPRGDVKTPQGFGFPICPGCGSLGSPFRKEAKMEDFEENHKKKCKIKEIEYAGFHVELRSDSLVIGPFKERANAVNLMEGIIIGSGMILDMGDSEIEGYILNDETKTSRILLMDPLPGGTGFLPQICEYWRFIAEKAVTVLESCKCNDACYDCMKRFRNQGHHDLLNRYAAVDILNEVMMNLEKKNYIPPVHIKEQPTTEKADSKSEVDFLELLQKHNFPLPPASQFHIDLGGGKHTRADYAYPVKKILIYIDGLSYKLHGNLTQKTKDTITRAKLRKMGFSVVEISVDCLKDDEALSYKLEEIAVYLEGEEV